MGAGEVLGPLLMGLQSLRRLWTHWALTGHTNTLVSHLCFCCCRCRLTGLGHLRGCGVGNLLFIVLGTCPPSFAERLQISVQFDHPEARASGCLGLLGLGWALGQCLAM